MDSVMVSMLIPADRLPDLKIDTILEASKERLCIYTIDRVERATLGDPEQASVFGRAIGYAFHRAVRDGMERLDTNAGVPVGTEG